VIDPHDIIKEFGAEAFRLWAACEGDMSKQDLSCSRDKIKSELKTISKIFNVARFVNQFEKPKSAVLTDLDRLFIDRIEELTEYSDSEYSRYDFYHPASKLRGFLWEEFASHFLEIVKNRAYNRDGAFDEKEQKSAHYALHYIFQRYIMLIYPIIPQVASVVGQKYGFDMVSAVFPSSNRGASDLSKIERIIEFNSSVWKAKKERHISLNAQIGGIRIPEELIQFSKDLKACHSLT